MKLAEKLDGLRSEFPECQTLAFADISTGMILYASTEKDLRQEQLDALCGAAVEMLSGATAKRINDAFPDPNETGICQAIVVEPSEICIFLKSTTNPADALGCVCSPSIELKPFIRNAREYLAQLEQDT